MQVGAFMEAYVAEVDFLVKLVSMFHVTKRRFIVLTFVPFGTIAFGEKFRSLNRVANTQALL